MKTTSLLIILMIVLSCNQQEQTESLMYQKNETRVIYAQQVYFSSAIAEINKLQQVQDEILAEIESGNESEALWYEFETTQQRIEILQNFSELLIGIFPSIGPLGPVPIPPDPCFSNDTAIGLNCDPLQDFSNVRAMVLFNDVIEVQSVQITNNENQMVGEGTEIFVGDYDQKTMALEHRFKNTATMHSVLYINGIGEINIDTPVKN